MSQNCSHTRNRPCSSHSTTSCNIINVNNITISISSNNLLRPKSCAWLRRSFLLLICLLLLLDGCATVAGRPQKSRSMHELKHSSRSASRFRSHKQPADSGFSLSIVSSLDVLRQNMVLEMKRQHIRHAKHKQIETNKEILDRIG